MIAPKRKNREQVNQGLRYTERNIEQIRKCLISWCAIFATSRGTTQMCDCRSTGFPNLWNFQRSMRSLKRETNQTLCTLSWRVESLFKALSPSIKIFPRFSTPWKTEMPLASWQSLTTTKSWTILAGQAISVTPKLLPRMQLAKNCQSPTKEWRPAGRLKNQDWSGFQLRRPNESFSLPLKRNQSIRQAPCLKRPRCNIPLLSLLPTRLSRYLTIQKTFFLTISTNDFSSFKASVSSETSKPRC